jgi:aminoglycoside 6-adenylyltransferase
MTDGEVNTLYAQLIERIIKWAEGQPDISVVIIIGSRARVKQPADEWSDLDALIVTSDPEYYLSKTDWLSKIGRPLLTFLEPAATGGFMERRVLFEGMLDVDFSIIPRENVQQLLKDGVPPQIVEIFNRGARVLVDRNGEATVMRTRILSIKPPIPRPPTEREFLGVVYDFLYHAVWTVKKLRRGELWTAKFCLDSHMKLKCLLPMIEWHTRATRGWTYDTWHGGRFLEQWAPPYILEGLQDAFAYYDKGDVKRALLSTMELFRRVSVETAEKIGYSYPTVLDRQISEWVKIHLQHV